MRRLRSPESSSNVRAKALQSCLTLCDSMDCSPPGSSVHGNSQGRMLEWVTMPPPGDLPDPRIEPLTSLALAGKYFTTSATWEAQSWACPINHLSLKKGNLALFMSAHG